jgi:hypothetical protein
MKVVTSQIQWSRCIVVGRCPGSWHGRALAKQPADVGANRMLSLHQVQGSAPSTWLFEWGIWIISALLGSVNLRLQLDYGRSVIRDVISGGARCHAGIVGQ